MSLSIHTNFASMVTQNQLTTTNKLASTAMQRLGTGLRINSAADDAAGLQIATRLQSQSNSQKIGMRNAQDAISMMQTAEGAMDEMTNIVQRMKDLATQAANGTSSDKDIAAMNAEFGELTKELKNIAGNTTFGGENLLDSKNGKFAKGEVTFQIGGTDSERLTLAIGDTLKKVVGGATLSAEDQALVDGLTAPKTTLDGAKTAFDTAKTDADAKKTTMDAAKTAWESETDATAKATKLGTYNTAKTAYDTAANTLTTKQTDLDTAQKNFDKATVGAMTAGSGLDSKTLEYGLKSQEHAQKAIGELESFMQDITSVRSAFGANINRLEHTVNNLSNMKENTDIAKGRIMDADFATESTNMTKNQMLMQAGMSVLGQANQMTGMVTGLLR
ncbi:flagellin N-terminal helical domain-containing protein [Aeromonas veronii]|uniref:flagellin N-terminal helical domain-containing protein n=1 Tax=Aeromonas veronii TaxID=654 RepID=UPI0021E8F277|nr:Lateral flagellin [Aeromonas veronii]